MFEQITTNQTNGFKYDSMIQGVIIAFKELEYSSQGKLITFRPEIPRPDLISYLVPLTPCFGVPSCLR